MITGEHIEKTLDILVFVADFHPETHIFRGGEGSVPIFLLRRYEQLKKYFFFAIL